MMKRFLAAVLTVILILSLAACAGDSGTKLPAVSGGDDSVLGTDFQKDMNQSTSYRIYNVCETAGGYYFQFNSMAYFVDKETGTSTILCSKPDCSHIHSESDTSCNAYMHTYFLNYYNGKLYYNNSDYVLENGTYVDHGDRLFSMNLDGTEHNVVQEIEFPQNGSTSGYVTEPMIHRGQVYFCYSGILYTVALGGDIDDAVEIYGEEIIDDGSMIANLNEMYYELWADGDMVYFMAKNVKQSNGTYKDTLYSYDPQEKKTEKIWQVPDKSDVGSWDTTGVSVSQWYIADGYIYFYLSGNDIWYTELSTGETNKLVDLDINAGVASFSGEYIVLISKEVIGMDLTSGGAALSAGDTMYVYGYDGKLVKEISLDKVYEECSNVEDCSILWVDDGKVYLQASARVSQPDKTYDLQTELIYTVDIESGSLGESIWSWSYGY